jgi:hypothetical protein
MAGAHDSVGQNRQPQAGARDSPHCLDRQEAEALVERLEAIPEIQVRIRPGEDRTA